MFNNLTGLNQTATSLQSLPSFTGSSALGALSGQSLWPSSYANDMVTQSTEASSLLGSQLMAGAAGLNPAAAYSGVFNNMMTYYLQLMTMMMQYQNSQNGNQLQNLQNGGQNNGAQVDNEGNGANNVNNNGNNANTVNNNGGKLDLKPNGGWEGTEGPVKQLVALCGDGFSVSSAKRDTQMTKSGNVSDHYSGNKDAYANDIVWGSSQPNGKSDEAASKIVAALGGPAGWGKNGGVFSTTINGIRYQVLYRTNEGGNHFNHIHLGAEVAGSKD
ncbi:MAG: hypothetical protein AB2L14_23260 [Candidatus Xenobiia bacterium LiM19]